MTISKSPTIPHEGGESAKQNTAVGSGSRPSRSMFPIPTSAPVEPHELSRHVSGALGVERKGKLQRPMAKS